MGWARGRTDGLQRLTGGPASGRPNRTSASTSFRGAGRPDSTAVTSPNRYLPLNQPRPAPAPRPRAVASFTQRVYFVSCWPGSCCDGLSASPNWAPCGLSAGHGTGNDIRARACPRGERRAPKLHASCVRAPALPEPRQSWCGCAHWRSGPSPSARPLSWAAELCSRGNKI